MERILDFIKWSLIVLLALVLVWAALAATRWLPRVTPVQRKSLAILNEPPRTATGHGNAFAPIWMWQYEIPAADLEAVANADLAGYRLGSTDPRVAFVSSAEGIYRRQEPSGDFKSLLCTASDTDCLAKIRTQTGATRQLLKANAALLDRARALEEYDYYHDRLPPNHDNPAPQIGGMGMLLLGDAALHFADGDKPEGLHRACVAALIWRRLALHADSRVVQSVAGGYFVGASGLFAGMRAELPADASLPASCQQAFASMDGADSGICDTMKIEFAKNASELRQVGDPLGPRSGVQEESRWSEMLGHLLTNGDAAVAYSAPAYASFCTHDAQVQREAVRLDNVALWSTCGVEQTLFDPIGCTLADLSNPRLRSPHSQFQEMQRMNVLTRAALAGGVANSSAHASGSQPDPGLPAGVSLDEHKQVLRIQRTFSLPDEATYFEVPLPGSRLH